jgi:alkylation response protein AidB-like acyl-CoA dehydrogenase
MSVNEADIFNITVDDLVAMARRVDAYGRRPVDDPLNRARLATAYARSVGVRYTRYRALTALSHGKEPGPEAAISKLVLGRNLQEIAKLGMDFRGAAGIVRNAEDAALGEMQEAWLAAAGLRIAGGTDQILRNTIAERVLGLPQETRQDRNIPFNQLQG